MFEIVISKYGSHNIEEYGLEIYIIFLLTKHIVTILKIITLL